MDHLKERRSKVRNSEQGEENVLVSIKKNIVIDKSIQVMPAFGDME